MASRLRRVDLEQVNRAVARLELTDAIWKLVPSQSRGLVETGLRCGAAFGRFLHHHPDGAGIGADDGVPPEQVAVVTAQLAKR